MNDLLRVITDMISICRDNDADDDEQRMAINTIEEAVTVEVKHLQTRIDELEGIIRASFVIWETDTAPVIIGTSGGLTDEMRQSVIALCKPRTAATTAMGDDDV